MICHALYHTSCVSCHLSGKEGTRVIQEWTTGQRSKLSLGALKRTKEIFLGYGRDKEFVVKGYIDVSFDTNLDDSKFQSGYILNVGAIS